MRCCNIAVAELDFVSCVINLMYLWLGTLDILKLGICSPELSAGLVVCTAEENRWVAQLFLSPTSICSWTDVHLLLQNLSPNSTPYCVSLNLISFRNMNTILNRLARNLCFSILLLPLFAHTELTNCCFTQHIWIRNMAYMMERLVPKAILMELKQVGHNSVRITSGRK